MRHELFFAASLSFLAACESTPPSDGPPTYEEEIPPEQPRIPSQTTPDAGSAAFPDATPQPAPEDAGTAPAPSEDAGPPALDDDPLSGLPTGPAQLAILCARNRPNAIARAFCTTPPPAITSIADLARLLQLDFAATGAGAENGINGNPAFAITAHSSSLVVRHVSAINPRAIVFTPNRNARADGEIVAMAFARGDQFVELAVSPARGTLTFYLFKYRQACNATASCTPADLLTPATDANFTEWSLYEDVDVANTTLDCLACHQPGGPNARRILRMQELEAPWAHWMFVGNPGGRGLIEDYQAAHPAAENYGPISGSMIAKAKPLKLKLLLVNEGFAPQPNAFDSLAIQNELNQSGRSATWAALYEEAISAREIPPPYHGVKITDPTKLANMTRAYAAFTPGGSLPDITDVIADAALADMSIRPKATLDGEGMIVHACGQCHNSRLDQTLSRARFDATRLSAMTRAQKDEAIRRLGLRAEDRRAMPPTALKLLSPAERALMIGALSR